MARDIDTNTLAEFTSNELQVYFAVEMTLPDSNNPAQNIVDRMWTGYTDKSITIDGATNTYTGMGELLQISSTHETSDLTANGLQLQIQANQSTIPALRDLEYQGKPLKVYLGAISQAGVVLPPINYFDGFNDKLTFLQTSNRLLVTITAEHNFIRMSQASNRRYTHHDQQSLYASDTGLTYANSVKSSSQGW